MAPIANSSGLQPLHIVIAIISCIILIISLPLVITAIWVICSDLQSSMFRDRPRYLKQEKLRKEWNKAALAEKKRQEIAKDIIFTKIHKDKESDEKWILFLELVSIKPYPRIYMLIFSAF
jgi:hypothetical protein